MERCRDYLSFAFSFAGLGYVVLWPLAVYGGDLFGAWPHPAELPPTLQIAGTLSALFAAARLLLFAFRRMRPVAMAPRIVLLGRPMPRSPLRHLPTVKPRAHFGLRRRRERS
jgi:hypothetical protein